jgi:hypothetical protein
MRRPLLLALFAGALAAGGTALAWQRLAGRTGAPGAEDRSLEGTALLALSEASVHFTLYWPEQEEGSPPPALVIFASDANADHPRPLRAWARAAARSGVAAAYLEPTDDPVAAAEQLKTVLERHAETLGIDGRALWTWAEGQGLRGRARPSHPPCGRNDGVFGVMVAQAERRLASAGHAVQRAFDFTVRSRCPLAGTP